jgi:hypothetical protein
MAIRTQPTLTVMGVTIAASLALAAMYLDTFLGAGEQGAMWRLERRRLAHALVAAGVLAAMALMSWAARQADVLGLLIGSAVVVTGAILIVLLWPQTRQTSVRQSTEAWLNIELSRAWGALVGTTLALVVPPLVTLSAAISTIALPIGSIPALLGERSVLHDTLTVLVQDVYLIHARVSVFALVGVTVVIGLSLLLVLYGAALVARRASIRQA